jgi:hypothetical protein
MDADARRRLEALHAREGELMTDDEIATAKQHIANAQALVSAIPPVLWPDVAMAILCTMVRLDPAGTRENLTHMIEVFREGWPDVFGDPL